MERGDRFWDSARRRDALNTADASGDVADSMEVRASIVRRIESGEITPEEGKAELAAIKRGAKAAGKRTRDQVWRES